ncbi:uncharacterized protein BCR38DRAFT_491069 [Pseudomassariella vexata]|uniref:Uncharacterized protein n=1 Tax=Pseudomassariella vexata TaxID=1141098 RepID=A0A1Y2D898_9PEZI|nr:uncharacterized protein BCR38DRAFT_491069 [Pseudomassariella vexata]ORY55437.1 hypothetical protein BCR38DRAFT_491069 [Pseudomassariella vexata]
MSSPAGQKSQGASGHKLVEGSLKPSKKSASQTSYTLPHPARNEVTFKRPSATQKSREPTEISSVAVAQPFVDPAVLERRARAQKKPLQQ